MNGYFTRTWYTLILEFHAEQQVEPVKSTSKMVPCPCALWKSPMVSAHLMASICFESCKQTRSMRLHACLSFSAIFTTNTGRWSSQHAVCFGRPAFGKLFYVSSSMTTLATDMTKLYDLACECDRQHLHLPWGRTPQGFATAAEVEYPHILCQEWARLVSEVVAPSLPLQEV